MVHNDMTVTGIAWKKYMTGVGVTSLSNLSNLFIKLHFKKLVLENCIISTQKSTQYNRRISHKVCTCMKTLFPLFSMLQRNVSSQL